MLFKQQQHAGRDIRELIEAFGWGELTARDVDFHAKVELDELVEARQDTSAGDTSQNVGTGSLHERHEALLLHDLGETVPRALVLLGLTRGHHHTTSNGVDRVRDETRRDRDSVAEREREQQARVITQQHRLQGIIETEIATAVDNDTHARDNEASVETSNAFI